MPYRPLAAPLRTDRLLLRPWSPDDLHDIRALVAERGGGEPDEASSRERLQRLSTALDDTGITLLVVERERRFLGYCGLVIGRSTLDEPEVAYELLRSEHGCGYATEAAGAVVRAAADTGRTRLWSTVRSWNAPSLRVLDKLGFDRHHTTADERGEIVWLTRSITAQGS